jgi:hypothetical protein
VRGALKRDRAGADVVLARDAGRTRVIPVMSASEVIELIKKLPPEELAEVREFVRRQDKCATEAQNTVDARGIDLGRAYMERHSELFRKLAE